MKRETLIKLFGLAMIIGGLTSFPLFLAAGFLGLYLRYRDRIAWIERMALILGAVFNLAFSVIVLVYIPVLTSRNLPPGPWVDLVSRISTILPFTALAVFGAAALRQRLMDRWSFLPLTAGLLWTIFLLAGIPDRFPDWEGQNTFVNFLAVFVTAYTYIGLVIMGVLLIRGEEDEEEGETAGG